MIRASVVLFVVVFGFVLGASGCLSDWRSLAEVFAIEQRRGSVRSSQEAAR